MTVSVPTLAARLRAGETIVTMWSSLAVPLLAEMGGRAGYESITLDMQHGFHDLASVREGIAAARLGGAHAVVRPPVDDFANVSRALDLGAEAVIMPMINSPDDAMALVVAAKYPPQGARSWGPHRAAMLLGRTPAEYLAEANSETLVLAMIETPAALAALDDILAVDGLDGVFVGPGDLSLTLSEGREVAPSSAPVQAHAADIATRTLAAGKVAGIYCNSAADATSAIGMGYRFVAHGSDLAMFAAEASRKRAELG